MTARILQFPERTADDVMAAVLRRELYFGLALSQVQCALAMLDDGTTNTEGALGFIRSAVALANKQLAERVTEGTKA